MARTWIVTSTDLFTSKSPSANMQLLAAAASLVCLGTALALECGVRKDFSAATFDAVNFAPGVSYHDVTNGIILNENLLDDGAMFFVKAAGIFYIKTPDGSCIKFEAPLLDVSRRLFFSLISFHTSSPLYLKFSFFSSNQC